MARFHIHSPRAYSLQTCFGLLPDLLMSMSFSSLPVPQFWALEKLFAVADPQGSSGPRLQG